MSKQQMVTTYKMSNTVREQPNNALIAKAIRVQQVRTQFQLPFIERVSDNEGQTFKNEALR